MMALSFLAHLMLKRWPALDVRLQGDGSSYTSPALLKYLLRCLPSLTWPILPPGPGQHHRLGRPRHPQVLEGAVQHGIPGTSS